MKRRGQVGLLFACNRSRQAPCDAGWYSGIYGEECKSECDLLRVRVIAINDRVPWHAFQSDREVRANEGVKMPEIVNLTADFEKQTFNFADTDRLIKLAYLPRLINDLKPLKTMAGPTRLELATSGVTVRSLHLTKTYQIVKNKAF